MSNLFLPPIHPLARGLRGWPSGQNRRPVIPLEVDPNHPLAHKLRAYIDTPNAVLWERVRSPVNYRSRINGTLRFLGEEFNQVQNSTLILDQFQPSNSFYGRVLLPDYTIVQQLTIDSYGEGGFGRIFSTRLGGFANLMIFSRNTGGRSIRFSDNSTGQTNPNWDAEPNRYQFGQPFVYSMAFPVLVDGSDVQGSINGAPFSAAQTQGSAGNRSRSGNTLTCIGNNTDDSTRGFDGTVGLTLFYDFLTPAEQAIVTRDIWRVFQPANQSHFAFPAEAAAPPPSYDETASIGAAVTVTATETWAASFTESAKIDSTVVVTATETFGTAYDETARIESTVVVSATEVFTPPTFEYDETARIEYGVTVSALEQYIGPAYTESAKIDSTVIVTATESFGTGFQESAKIETSVVVTAVESWTPPAFMEAATVLSTVVVTANETFDTPSRLPGGIETLSAELIGGFFARKI